MPLSPADGPGILGVPPASAKTIFFGTVIDAWQSPLVDVGPAWEDAGKGGKYLFLPPGYNKPIPEGYLVYRPKTFHLYVALRPVSIQGGTLEEAVGYSKQLEAYPHSQAAVPPPRRYIDGSAKNWNTFGDDGHTVQYRHSEGAPLKPDAETAKALHQAAKDGYARMQQYPVTPGKALVPYWSGNPRAARARLPV